MKFNRAVMTAVLMVMSVCLASPGWAASNTLTPDSGTWSVEINADGASVAITGMEQPYSSVQVTVQYMRQGGNLADENRFPVNVPVFRKAKITPRKDGFLVKRISFECTKGKVYIEASPATGSGGGSFY